MKDIHGTAISDYYQGAENTSLKIHNNYDTPEEMPVAVFFRDELDFTVLENLALIECNGKTLDLGAGAGAHALVLQARGFDVHALENSPGCVEVMRQSGVRRCIEQNYESHLGSYDTILCLMNGLGLAGTVQQIPSFLKKCMSLLGKGGQLLIDSSDIRYLYDNHIVPPSHYHGEVRYQYEYKNAKGDWFDWVYVDQALLASICKKVELQLEILHTDENDQYLSRITAS